MTIEAIKSAQREVGKKLVTIDDAIGAFRALKVCPEDQIEDKIRYYGQTYPEFSSNDVEAAAVALDMLLSMDPLGRERFKERYGVLSSGARVIKEKAFGGLDIDPQRANLPAK